MHFNNRSLGKYISSKAEFHNYKTWKHFALVIISSFNIQVISYMANTNFSAQNHTAKTVRMHKYEHMYKYEQMITEVEFGTNQENPQYIQTHSWRTLRGD